ncbi:terpenoid synthase [Ramicandelaber brevisporus]|nr:terpenoid synthase [Ramicandelaber brevisporus]
MISLSRLSSSRAVSLSNSAQATLSRQCSQRSIIRVSLQHKQPYHQHLRAYSASAQPQSWNEAVKRAEDTLKSGLQSTQESRNVADVLSPKSKGAAVLTVKELVGQDLAELTGNIRRLLASGHPMLETISSYYFRPGGGKHIRPLMVLLMSQATSIAPKVTSKSFGPNAAGSTDPFPPSSSTTDAGTDKYLEARSVAGCAILPTQVRLAEIAEMIHTASLMHDDVIDKSDTRRGQATAHIAFGNKAAVLAGDFLLARASVAICRLRNTEVTELFGTIIGNLVEGEFMQMKNMQREFSSVGVIERALEYYLEKTYMKTAALIANSCRGAALLGGCTDAVVDMAYQYGRNVGMAFQIIDDLLDFTVTEAQAGKPVGADLQLGLATAPVLFAWQEYPELGPLIQRRFSEPGDSQRAWQLVHKSQGIEKTRQAALEHVAKAIKAVSGLPESPARQALIDITQQVINRTK